MQLVASECPNAICFNQWTAVDYYKAKRIMHPISSDNDYYNDKAETENHALSLLVTNNRFFAENVIFVNHIVLSF